MFTGGTGFDPWPCASCFKPLDGTNPGRPHMAGWQTPHIIPWVFSLLCEEDTVVLPDLRLCNWLHPRSTCQMFKVACLPSTRVVQGLEVAPFPPDRGSFFSALVGHGMPPTSSRLNGSIPPSLQVAGLAATCGIVNSHRIDNWKWPGTFRFSCWTRLLLGFFSSARHA